MSRSDDINIAITKASQSMCDHRFKPDTGFGFTCMYCGLQMTSQNASNTIESNATNAVPCILKHVNNWNAGKISSERLSEEININFYELSSLLTVESTSQLLWFVMPYLEDILWESHNSEDQLKTIMEMVSDLYKQLKTKYRHWSK